MLAVFLSGKIQPGKLTCPLEDQWLEDVFPIENSPFSVDMLVFRGVSTQKNLQKLRKQKISPSLQVHDSDALELDMHAMEHVRDPQRGPNGGE